MNPLVLADLDVMWVRVTRWIERQTELNEMSKGCQLLQEIEEFQFEISKRLMK